MSLYHNLNDIVNIRVPSLNLFSKTTQCAFKNQEAHKNTEEAHLFVSSLPHSERTHMYTAVLEVGS